MYEVFFVNWRTVEAVSTVERTACWMFVVCWVWIFSSRPSFWRILNRYPTLDIFAMWWTSIRCSPFVGSSELPRAVRNLLPKKLPPSLSSRPGNLYEVISRCPGGSVGKKVHQFRWSEKQIPDSYWVVTRAKFKCEGKHGKAWGMLYWKGSFTVYLPVGISRGVNCFRQTCQYKGGADTGCTEVHMEGGSFCSEDECMTYSQFWIVTLTACFQ